jgi:hypothetical protein
VLALALLVAGGTGAVRLSAQTPAPVLGRVRIDGPGSFGPRPGERLAVIVDGRRLGSAVCDSSRRLVPNEGATREWLRAADPAKVATVVLVMGPRAAREYELHGGEAGAVVITTKRSANDSL